MILKYKFFTILLLLCATLGNDLYAGDPYGENKGLVKIELGVLNAVARTYDGQPQLELTEVREGLLKAAGLKVGDHIIAANGTTFTNETRPSTGTQGREVLGYALWNSGHSANNTLTLKYERAGKPYIVQIAVPQYANDRTQMLRVCDEILADSTTDDGAIKVSISDGASVSMAIQGLVLLASREEKYQKLVGKLAEQYFAFAKAGTENSNWKVSYAGTFLGEYYLATGDARALEALSSVGHLLAVRSNETGALSHAGLNYGEGMLSKNPYSSRGMSIVTTQAVLVWNYMEKAGILTDPIDIAARKKAVEILANGISNTGSVGYNVGSQSQSRDSMGRASNYANIMQVADFPNDTVTKGRLASTWLVSNKRLLLYGHASSLCSYWSSMSALYTLKPTGWQDAVSTYNWYRALTLLPEGSARLLAYTPARQNSSGDAYVNEYKTAQALIGMQNVLAAGTSKLHLHGGREKNWYEIEGVTGHLLDVVTGKNGAATPSHKYCDIGADQSITITPKAGFKVASVKTNSGYLTFTGNRDSSVVIELKKISESHRLFVTFVKSTGVPIPPELASLALHLNANASTATGTASKWQDYSGFNHSAMMTTTAQEPNIQPNQLNGNSMMDFSGDRHFNLTGAKWSDLMVKVSGGAKSTWYVVTKVNNLSTEPQDNRDDKSTQILGDAQGNRFLLGVDHEGFRTGYFNELGVRQGPKVKLYKNQPTLLEVVFNAGELTLTSYYSNGMQFSQTKTMGDVPFASLLEKQPNIADKGDSDTTKYYDGKIGEIMIYKDALSSGDRKGVRDYLLKKWLPSAVTPAYGVQVRLIGEELTWDVDYEDAVISYIVEKKVNGKWNAITTVAARGEANATYSVTVAEAGEYRITALDAMGFKQSFAPKGTKSTTFIKLSSGWNLISVPCDNADLSAITGGIWAWGGHKYIQTDSATAGQGLWIYAEKASELELTGDHTKATGVSLAKGWNLIGPLAECDAPSKYTIFTWETTYKNILETAGKLIPGKGYWFYSAEEEANASLK